MVSTLISVNGWATFIGGILIVIFACFEMTSDELALDIFTAVVAAADHGPRHLRHVPHRAEDQSGADVGAANVSVGWGLICVLSAAVLATLVTLLKLIQR